MILADVNVLIGAYRPDTPQHAVCRQWLERIVHGDAAYGVSKQVLSSVVRITTNRRIFSDPDKPGESFAFCNWLLGRPNAVVVEPGERHWVIFERLCLETGTTGPGVTDAWLAALAIEHGCEWVTLDRDFARFSGLKWRSPD